MSDGLGLILTLAGACLLGGFNLAVGLFAGIKYASYLFGPIQTSVTHSYIHIKAHPAPAGRGD